MGFHKCTVLSLVVGFLFIPCLLVSSQDSDVPIGAASLAFVFDITGSMYDDLVQVIEGAAKILATALSRREKPLYNYVLVPFHDPDIGPYLVTSDPEEFQRELRSLYVQGGGDCPEMSIGAIQLALEVSLPNSFIYVFTDARSKDYYLTEDVLALIQQKQSQVVFVLTGDCGNNTHRGYKAYEEIASTSSGQVFLLKKSDVNQVLNFVRVTVQARKVNLMSVDEDEAKTQTFAIPIDSKLQEITVSVSGESPRIILHNPFGSRLLKRTDKGEFPTEDNFDEESDKLRELLNITNVLIYNVKDPTPGMWKLEIGSLGAHTIRVTGLSTVDFAAGFAKHSTKNFSNTDLRPVKGVPTHVLINTTDMNAPAVLTKLELVDLKGNVLAGFPVLRDPLHPALYNVSSFIPPDNFFYLKVDGIDEEGFALRRTTPTAISPRIPTAPNVYMEDLTRGFFDQTAVLTCTVQSLVPYSVRWFRGGKQHGYEVNYFDSANVTLEIPRAGANSEGDYYCNASNIAGFAVTKTYLDISDPPPVISKTWNVSVLPGDDAILTCNAYSVVEFNMSWSTPGRFGIGALDPRTRILSNGSLFIRNAQKKNEGMYICKASNEGGSTDAQVFLRLQETPVARTIPAKQNFVVGKTVNITCVADGYPEPTYTWLKGGQFIVPTDRMFYKNGVLTIRNVQRSDDGDYECLAKNVAGEDIALSRLSYIEAPNIRQYERRMLVATGDKAVLYCNADGIPHPEITWYRGKRKLQAAYNVDVTLSGQLIISNVEEADEGEYQCVATNEAGRDQAKVILKVGSPPSIVIPPGNVGIEIEKNGSLGCEATGIPSPKIIWRRGDGKPLDNTGRFQQLPSGGLAITNIQLGDEGIYSCLAQNTFGVADASAFVSVTGIVRPLIAYTNPFVKVHEGDTAELECVVLLGKPTPSIMWMKNRKVIQGGNRIKRLGPGKVAITNISQADDGEYVCVASNIGGNATYSINVDVLVPPRMLQEPIDKKTNFSVIHGRGVVLPCRAEGDPPPNYQWYKDGSPISLSDIHYFVREDGSLEIFSAAPDDTGIYKCVVSNIAGGTEKDVSLFVQVGPVISGELDEQYEINEGEDILLPCDASGTPKPLVFWRRNFSPFRPKVTRIVFQSNGLFLKKAKIRDKAIYECVASNIAGNTTKVITLIVYIPPEIDAGKTELVVMKDDSVTLQCETSGDPNPTVQWKKDNVIMDLTDMSKGVFMHDTGSITFDHAKLKDSALYSCSAINPAGAATQDFRLTVQAPPSLPLSLPSYTEIIENNPVILPCPAIGTPPPKIVWLKDGFPIIGTELGVVMLTDGSLELANAQASDSGRYRCIAENVAGNASHAVNLKILVPPKLVSTGSTGDKPDQPTVIVNDSKTIVCPVAEDVDPPPIILWYKDDHLIEYLGPDARVVISSDGRELIIKRALVEDTARYRCIASNSAGEIEKLFDLDVLVPPTVDEETSSFPNLTVVVGESLFIDCPLTGIPPPVVKWFKDGEPVDPQLDSNILIHASGRRLELKSATVSDRGLYKCVGENIAGNTKKEYSVLVHVPPKVDKPGEVEQAHVVKGSDLSLNCPVSGIPLPDITWMKNEVPIKQNSTKYTLLDGGWTLLIKNVEERDSGRHYCLAENVAGENEKAFDVEVLVPPEIRRNQTTSSPNVIVNSTAVMSCPVNGHPIPEILWYRNGVLLDSTVNPRYEILANGRQIRIHNTQYKDRGKYTCSTRNRAGDDSLDFDLDVWVPPKIDTQGANFEPRILVNGTIHIDCRSTGNPPPVILWFKDNKAVKEDADVKILDGGSRLEIRNAAVEDTGRYTCIARNEAGESDQNFKLAVHVPPVIPTVGIIMDPKVIENETVVLDCPAQGIPTPDVIWYQNGQPLDLELNSHMAIKEAGRRLVIEEAQVPDSAKYTCIATNEAGEAENNYELEVWVPPTIDDSARDENPRVIKSHTATMNCPVSGIPFPSIQWLKNNEEIAFDARTQIINSGLVLKIMNATESDTALYTCFVISPAGEDRANYNLVVLVPPSIDESNVVYNPRVIQERRVLMECPVSGIPIPEVQWLKDGKPVVTNPGLRILNSNLHLEIVRAQVEDSARYTCIASNEAGELVRNFNLEVLVPPSIDKTATEDNLSVVQNKTININCPVTGIPPPSMLWLKDRTPLLDFPYRDLRVLNSEQTLEVSNAQLDDAGTYTCKATNPAGQDKAIFNLEVFVPPNVAGDKTVNKLNVVLHHSATLECQAEGIPKPSVLWLKDGKIIVEENDHNLKMVSDGRVLKIEDAEIRHTGRYKCHAENQAGFTEKLYDLNVMVPPSINGSGERQERPIIIDRPVLLDCPAEGIPKPDITWFRQGRPIPKYGIPNIRIHNAGKQLQVQSAQLLDSGEYRCMATNEAGQATLEFFVFIRVPPEIAEGETRIAAQVGSRALLRCEASGQPSPKVTWVKDGEPFPSTSLRHRQLHAGSLEFSNIHLENAGSYTCTASNDAGNVSRTIELGVQVPAHIIPTGPQTIRAPINKPVILPCDVEGTPPPRILWLKNRAVLSDNEGYQLLENGSLSIRRIDLGHSGVYTCIAQNYAGIDKRDLRLQVQVPPRIEASQREFQVLQNRTVVMPCHTRGNPKPKILWLKDGQEITSASYDLESYSRVHYITLQTGGLAIPHARAEDTGNYRCIAKNQAGNASLDLTLTVQIPPSIEAASRQYVVSVGERAVLPCNASGIPPPKVSWTYDGRWIDGRQPKYIINHDGSLIVQQVKATDAGRYMCTAQNIAGRDTRNRLLRVQVPPRFVIRPQNVELTVNDRLEMRCAAEGIPTPFITWMLNGEQLSSPPSINGRSSYIVRNVMRADAGEYTCVAANPANDQFVNTIAQVVVKVPPRMLVPPGNRAVRIAEKVVLTCSVGGDPIPEILWTKNGRPVELSHRIQQLSNGSLVIYDSTSSDAGEYRCIAVNDAGTLESAAYLTIWSEPSFAMEPPRSSRVNQGQTIVLDCTANGVPKPDMYWWKVTTPIESEGRFTILPNNSLRIVATQLNDSALYRCFASNKLGKTFVESELKVVVHGSWGEWGEFGDCSSSCGRGFQYRTRSCNNPAPANGGKQCIGAASDSSSCLTANCPVNGNWGNWNEWEQCTSSCGPGRRQRHRQCNNPPPQFNGLSCHGADTEWDGCNIKPCPIDGKWGEWAQWSPCSLTCGEGYSTRIRKCDSPHPQYGGQSCGEDEEERKSCRAQACAVDGNWGLWNEWSLCSLSCGGGMMSRSRRCDHPRPQYGGSNCLGIGEQKDYCNNEQCPIHGNWAPWSEFGECTASCNSGKRRRFRTCTNPVPTNGGRSCGGPAEDTDVCNTQPCPVNGNWDNWGEWSPCSKTCDGGTRDRRRKCHQPKHGGRPCRGDNVQIAECVIKLCDQSPRVAMGNLIGNINNIDIVESTIVSEMNPTTSGTKVTATIRNVPKNIARHLQHLISLLTPVYWTTASEIDGAVNGYTLTKGEFNREVQVEFATGEVLKMTHYVTGVNPDGVLNFDIIIRGEVPDLGPLHNVYLAPYNEQYIQTGPGTIYAYSSRLFRADGRMMPYAWNHTITYNPELGKMPYLVQELYTEAMDVSLDPNQEAVHFQLLASIAPGSPSNRCPTGFFHDADGSYCRDDNECERVRPCSHFCHNSPGSYACSCPTGFTLQSDGRSCRDFDECEKGSAICPDNQECLNSVGSYQCVTICTAGFIRSPETLNCEDINECEVQPNLCEQSCENLVGSYRCSCSRGYRVDNNGHCQDVNECRRRRPPCFQKCINTRGSYRCGCRKGYRLASDRNNCIDVNECYDGSYHCRSDQECVNTKGGYDCIDLCKRGYQRVANGQCEDIDECATGQHRCFYNQRCVNKPGSYHCRCPRGFTSRGPGQPCTDVNECLQIPRICNFRCINNYGGFECICAPGQIRLADKKSCAGLEFVEPSRIFSTGEAQSDQSYHTPRHSRVRRQLSTEHTLSSKHFLPAVKSIPCKYGFCALKRPRLKCPQGTKLDLKHKGRCLDIDECRSDSHPCQYNCTNTVGWYRCTCPPGYRLATDRHKCVDINECVEKRINCGAEKMCFNTRGSHTCIDIPCPKDYARDPTTQYCVLECVNPKIPCPPGAKYADVIQFHTLSLPSGTIAQDLIRLTAFNQDDEILIHTTFKILDNDPKLEFEIRMENGKGVVFTQVPLRDGDVYRIKVKAKSYDNQRQHIQYQTTFIIHISVSSWPF